MCVSFELWSSLEMILNRVIVSTEKNFSLTKKYPYVFFDEIMHSCVF